MLARCFSRQDCCVDEHIQNFMNDHECNDDWFQREQLHFAAQDGDLERIKVLISEGCDVTAFDEVGMTPLHYAAKKEHFEVAELLIEHGADVNAHHKPTMGNTPLCEVAGECSFRMAKLLVDAGADPNIPGWMQRTAIQGAEARKREEGQRVYELLLGASKRRHA